MPNTDLEWTITILMEGNQREYKIKCPKSYGAKVNALKQFIEEFKLPYSPSRVIREMKEFIEVHAKCSEDGRVLY